MFAEDQTRKIIGRAEQLIFPELGLNGIPARIDTGAKTSSIWVSHAVERDGILAVTLFGEGSSFFTGKELLFHEYETTIVSTSTGEEQQRYKIRLLVKIKGKRVRAWFTLADRSTQVYPVLIGRNVLLGKFIVDVKKGRVLKDEEQKRTQALRSNIKETKE